VTRGNRATDHAGAATRTRRLQNLLFVVALLGIAGGAGAGFLFARETAEDDAQDRVDAIAAAAGLSVGALLDRATDALGGASAVVDPDGSFDLDAFEAYARDVANEGAVGPVALIGVVEGPDRAAVEELIGGPLRSLGADGRLTTAPDADRYYPVLATPVVGDEPGFTALGLDYRSDPVRGPATDEAAATGMSVVSDPTLLPRTAERGVVIVHPLFVGGSRGTGPLAGFVATGVVLGDLLDALAGTLPVGASLALHDGDDDAAVAARSGPGGEFATQVPVDIGSQRWLLTVDPDEEAEDALAKAVLAGGVAAELWVLVVFVTTVRYQRRMRRANESLARAENRSRTLERLGSKLSQSLSGAEVGRATLESLPGLTGAIAGAVAVLSDDGTQLELVDAWGYGGPGPSEALARVPIEGSLLAEVVRTGEPAWLSSPLAWRDDPVVGRYTDGGRAAAVVALQADHSAGVLVIVQPNVRSFGDDERSLVTTVAALAARALDRSLRYDADHATAVAFQQASLPIALPVAEGIDVAARYRPATRLAEVGGDWYDVFNLADGRPAVLVGDVVGHGVSAAAAMGQVRVAVRMLAGVEPEPRALLRLLGNQVPEIPDAMCATMAFGIVEVEAGRFSYVLAGHPPPVLLRRDQEAVLLDASPWPPLGVVPNAEPPPAEVAIGPDDVLVLYTDGVVERRGESLADGLERLRSAAQALRHLPPEELADALLEATLPGGDQADDVALLVVQVCG
jgi:serine phosphatase RsbU (regulator of sigma subunit)